MKKIKKNKKWYCTGTHYNAIGERCAFEECVSFKYVPTVPEDDSRMFRADWIFDNEDDCRKMCKKLNDHNAKVMKKAGITDFRTFIQSRAHEVDQMLTVKDLIKYLKTQDPDALVVGYEPNSLAYISQSKAPSRQIRTVAEDKVNELECLKRYYKDTPKVRQKKIIADHMKETYRYVQDNDVIIGF